MKRQISHQTRGIALVMTLAMLVIATILVVGFATAMRTERQAASTASAGAATASVAQSAVEHAVALLERNIPAPVPAGGSIANPSNWVVSPGLLTTIDVSGTRTQIPLSTNPTATYSAALGDADINAPLTSSSGGALLGGSNSLRVAWMPVLQDPSIPVSGTNKIVGRYAFWVDDENSKININTAYGKPSSANLYGAVNPNSYNFGVPSYFIPVPTAPNSTGPSATNPHSLGRPTTVSLDVLPGVDRDALWTARSLGQFVSPSQVARFGVDYQQHKFSITTTNRDPEFNVFGKSRIFLTDATFRASDLAASPPITGTPDNTFGSVGFTYAQESSSASTMTVLRDREEPLTFHSDGNTSASTTVDPDRNPTVAAVTQLASYLGRSWPGFSKSFVQKWSANPSAVDIQGYREAQQVAWNIYGMAASASTETTNGRWANLTPASARNPQPARFASFLWDGPRPDANWPASKILPQTRSPFVTKFGASFIATQYTRGNTTAKVPGVNNTNRYVVNVRLAPQIRLPSGYQGVQYFSGTTAQPWRHGDDEVYITHFEATVDDGSGSGPKRVIWSSSSQTEDGSLYRDPDGGTLLKKFSGQSGAVLNPDARNQNFRGTVTSWDFSSHDNTVAPSSPPPPGYSTRNISFIFDAGADRRLCRISNVKLRFIVTTGSGANIAPYQISPIRDIDSAPGFETPNTADSGAITFPSFDLPTDNIESNAPEYWVAMETLDPRNNQRGTPPNGPTATDDWQQATTPALPPSFAAAVAPVSPSRSTRLPDPFPQTGSAGDESELAWLDASPQLTSGSTRTRWGHRPSHFFNRMPSVGLLSLVATGMQGGIPWRTLRFQPSSGDPPDWLLLDLFAVPFNRVAFVAGQPYTESAADQLSYLNSSAGKVNINSMMLPADWGLPSDTRDMPVKALFRDMFRPSVGSGSPAQPNETSLFNNIVTYLTGKTNRVFDYAGEICEVPGFADVGSNDWEREALIRNLAGLITTRSNTFSVFGVAQQVRKNPANTQAGGYGIFETRAAGATADDVITGERRFRALVERYVWPGVDDRVGNASTNTSGTYNQLGSTAYLGSTTNTVDGADPAQATFRFSANPTAPVMRYRIVQFEYLN